MEFDLRKAVESYVSRAVDSVKHYNGQEYDQNRHNWVQITTDRVLAAVMNSLPEPIDLRSKYEGSGIYLNLEEGNQEHQLDYLSHYAEDQGYNKFFFTYTDYLKRLYTIPQGVVQSGHEQDHNPEDGNNSPQDDSPNDKEPSEVR